MATMPRWDALMALSDLVVISSRRRPSYLLQDKLPTLLTTDGVVCARFGSLRPFHVLLHCVLYSLFHGGSFLSWIRCYQKREPHPFDLASRSKIKEEATCEAEISAHLRCSRD